MIDASTKLCCIIGNPVKHSLSPLMHNAAYSKSGLNFVFLAFKVKNLKAAVQGLKELNVQGIAVTVPYKSEVIRYVDEIDETAKQIGAVNTIVNKNGRLISTNTDWLGAMDALVKEVKIKDKTVAVLGAGGAARAVVFGLKKYSAGKILIFNRTVEKAKKLADELNSTKITRIYPLPILTDGSIKDSASIWQKIAAHLKSANIIINTTSLGMPPNHHLSPIPKQFIYRHQIVYDIVYTPQETKLLSYAKAAGAKVIYGKNMLLQVAKRQFEIFTGIKPPPIIMEKILNESLRYFSN